MSGRLMLDPSLVLAPDGPMLMQELVSLPRGEVVVPETLVRLLQSGEVEAVSRYFGQAPADRRRRWDDVPTAAESLFERRVGGLRQLLEVETVVPYGVPEFDRSSRWGRLSQSDDVSRILFEEWTFLQGESWLASRIRRPFSAFIRRGALGLEVGRETFDRVVEKTLRLENEEVPKALTHSHRLRAATKWLAVGGPAVIPLLGPIWAGTALGLAGGYFLLMDP